MNISKRGDDLIVEELSLEFWVYNMREFNEIDGANYSLFY